VVIVFPEVVAANTRLLLADHVMPADTTKLPYMYISGVFETLKIVPVKPVKFKLLQLALTVAIVTVPAPELASKNTLSAEVGTEAPPAPPEVVAHLVPAVPSQLAVPPTQ